MARSDRLFDLMQILRDGKLHTAATLAARTGVSTRTLYRDMETLAASGVPVTGTRGTGYRFATLTPLPPLNLTDGELEALNLGLAIASELADPDLRAAAQSLGAKLDAVLPETAQQPRDAWHFASTPFANAARGFALMPTLRAAIKARQKLRLTYTAPDGTVSTSTVRPLQLDYLGRIWTLTAWCEARSAHRRFRLDLIDSAQALAELFTDEPGKALSDLSP